VTGAPIDGELHDGLDSGLDSGLAGRIALVTGAAGEGIGQAVARRLAADGATVVVTDIHPSRTEKVAASIAADHGGRAVGMPMDAGSRADIAAVTARVAGELGPITVLVNNAACNIMGSIFDYNPADWDRVMDINLNGPWFLSREAMRQMRDAGGGTIVNISSYAPDVGGMGLEGPYAVSKGGLGVLTRSCAHEGGPHGIRVNTVTMGMVTGTRFIDTLHPDMTGPEIARAALRRLPDTGDIAEVVSFLVSDRARNITGETINVAAGAHMRW
jgi:NAD(P)-dependent dehydrogenase (short-subunit alcohol dehydrogenase family)